MHCNHYAKPVSSAIQKPEICISPRLNEEQCAAETPKSDHKSESCTDIESSRYESVWIISVHRSGCFFSWTILREWESTEFRIPHIHSRIKALQLSARWNFARQIIDRDVQSIQKIQFREA